MGLLAAMFLIFMTLKLTHVIDWSWWWVSCPLWAPFAFIVMIFLLSLVGVSFSWSAKLLSGQKKVKNGRWN